ncbi:MAG TPA: Ig-like domain-containing protein [Vicinamibacterales bacterium]|nr:Ig-like domain-containing protein [Vicinamibacterales bacterium]
MIRLALRVLLIVLLAAGSAQPQTPARRLATIDAVKQFPGFYHLQNVLIRGELADAAPRLLLRADEHDVRVMLEDGVATRSGPVEVRGLLIDVGRLEPGDPRVGSYAEGRDADRWPRPGEELIVRASGVVQVAAAPSTPSVRAIALEPWKFDGQRVTVVGNFRGRNLFGDLPGAPGKSKYDFVLRGAEGAVWVTNLRPKGNGFDLDVNRRVDSDRWLEVTGTIVRDNGLVTIDATKLALAKAPQVTEAPAESAAPAAPLEPVHIVFSSPTDGETDVTPNGSIRIQFSRGLSQPSLEGQIRVSYLGAPRPDAGAPPSSLAFTVSYDAGSRAIQIKMSQPLDPFATVRVELLDGIKGFDGGPVAPWSLTFSVGG